MRYSIMEKFALTIVTLTRKIKPYFQLHQVILITNQSVKKIFHNSEIARIIL